MNQANSVKINQSIKHGFQHLASFRIDERTLGENLGEVFFGILHYDEETVPVLKAAAADFEDAQQMGMNELHNATPERDLEIGGGTSGNEFDGRFLRFRIGDPREKNGGIPPPPPESFPPESIASNLTPTPF